MAYGVKAVTSYQNFTATAYFVFFLEKKTAEAFARQHGGKVTERDGGWAVEKKITEGSDDPITRAIRLAIKDLPRD